MAGCMRHNIPMDGWDGSTTRCGAMYSHVLIVSEFAFWDRPSDTDAEEVLSKFPCPSCSADVVKRIFTHATERVS